MTRWMTTLVVFCGFACAGRAAAQQMATPEPNTGRAASIRWAQCLRQRPEWYGGAEARRIAENLLLYQFDSGGWDKNLDMAAPLGAAQKAKLAQDRKAAESDRAKNDPSTIDNGSITEPMRYQARVFKATGEARMRDSFLKGLDLLLAMQYPNGGWPQYAFRKGYHTHITFNDNAMINVMTLLREVAAGAAEVDFVDAARRARAEAAVNKGVECILKCQVRVGGRLTAWCAQHDEQTLAPAPARAYEKISLSGSESVGIVKFLMGMEKPAPAVREAVEAAVAWFKEVKITGLRVETVSQPDPSPTKYDRVVVKDPRAGALWARFYEIGTNRPLFCGRDGVIKYSLAEIEIERRSGYSWYVNNAAPLLEKDYPAWQAKEAGEKKP